MGIISSENDTTNSLTQRIIFGDNRHPGLIYTDLSTGKQYGPGEDYKMPAISEAEYEKVKDKWKDQEPPHDNCFPGYYWVYGNDGKYHNMYRGVDLSLGGYVYAEPGMYLGRLVTKDSISHHPHSIKSLRYLGDYTDQFWDIYTVRVLLKHHELDKARAMFNGLLADFLKDEESASQAAKALKTAINASYGQSYASFDNPFKDPRNVNNIVALKGSLFMKTLQDEVTARGYKVVHIKTDSIKLYHPDDYILNFCDEFAKKFGYEFEVEHTWNKLCLVNDAVFVGKYGDDDKHAGEWETTGAQFQVPYVKKSLFTHEPIEFYDMTEAKSVQNVMYLDMNENLPDDTDLQKKRKKAVKEWGENSVEVAAIDGEISKCHKLEFVGRDGLFCPVIDGIGGGKLLYRNNAGKLNSVTGTKDYRWLEAGMVKGLKLEDKIDKNFYINLVNKAVETISKYGDFEAFAAD